MSDQDENKPKSIFDEAEEPDDDAIKYGEEKFIGSKLPKEGSNDESDEGDKKYPEVSVTLDDDMDPYDHSAELEDRRQREEELGVAPPEQPKKPIVGVHNPAVMEDPVDLARDEIEKRFNHEEGGLEVEVTQSERSDFVRAALHDAEMSFDIDVLGIGIKIKVVVPSDNFTALATSAVNQWAKDGHIDEDSNMQWLLTFQQLHAWFQVREIDGEPTPWSSFWEDGMPSTARIKRHLESPENFEEICKMQANRWRMIMHALRLAERKYKICMENWHDRSFFTGADTA